MQMQKTLTQVKNRLKDIQWWWLLGTTFAVFGTIQIVMFLIISLYVARTSAAGTNLSYDEIGQFSEMLGARVGPFIFWALTLVASIWLAIKVRVAPRAHGLVLGFLFFTVTIAMDQLFSPPLKISAVINNLVVIPIAWYGSVRGKNILRNREALYRTSQAIKGADRPGIVKAIGEQLASPLVALIALVDQDGKVDSVSTWTPSPNQAIPATIPIHPTTLEPASTPQGATVLKGARLPLADSGIHSLLVLPLSQVDETLVVGSRSRDGFSRTNIQNYLTIAEQVALSLENLKLLEKAHQTGITQERQRLAAEIHDSLTQGFISIVTFTEITEAKLEKYPLELRDELQPLLNQARQTARDNLTAARQMTWALRPDLQQVVPLTESLASLANNWAAKSGTPVEFSSSGDARQLHPDVETALVRTMREALTNIQKHARATQVTVTLTYMDTLVALDVQDNGQGCDSEAISQNDSGGGFGLKSIRKQIEQLGGELTIESEPGKGCTVAIGLPAS